MTRARKTSAPVEARVTLVAVTPDGERLVAAAARLCYASDPTAISRRDPEDNARLVRMVVARGHLSTIEHVSFTFLLEGVSRAMTHQLVRHRVASYSQRSQRYVAEHDFAYVMPPRLRGKKVATTAGEVDAEGYFHETMVYLAERYAALCEAFGGSTEESREDARYVLPNACETRIIVTMNGRELRHFFEERLCLRAQWEIRAVAERMRVLAAEACPSLFAGAGPKCVRMGRCPEGPRGCGAFAAVRARYRGEQGDD
ncbi:MAG TPA: FAD-dependent thymidylate synthase [Planctomycetota bacterium]|nr:FAD-dependent thymidylate synthase [Planctomycetota bacterium]OQC19892.1 MAG: Thymidylate synthase ThyX [Planctomycetes bacterium ADurb.Bin069]HNR98385.1 FAD-dependent thymidylate synthase [Planctomycetota bacterium]HNU26274.1 FAD-dependent thymidylate synthase [Planctomycetota bacterium]HOE28903.1 FAD-dependent thymidylate synthase [Planctomycetota bacterium]